MSGVAGMRWGRPLPDSELAPCGTRAAYRRHLRRGLRGRQIDAACRQAELRAWRDRPRRSRPPRVHLDGPGRCYRCYRWDVKTTADPDQVTCRDCLAGYGRLPWVRAAAQAGERARAA